MPQLATRIRAISGTASTDDRGAINAIFAILLASGLLIAVLGLVVDTGQVMAERQLVRKAADSVAEAVAIHCAKAVTDANCLTDFYTSVNTFSAVTTASQSNSDFLTSVANPKGGDVVVSRICGRAMNGLGISSCPPLTSSPNDCKTNLASTSAYPNWVRVYTQSGPGGIQPAFENLLSGSTQAYQETSCAQVYWGTANAITVDTTGNQLPFVFGMCTVLAASYDRTMEIYGDQSPTSCNTEDRSGQDVSSSVRGFMQFDPSDPSTTCWTLGSSNCTTVALSSTKAKTGTTYPQLGYNGLISAMKTRLTTALLKKTIMLPVVTQTGPNYTVKGYVGFTLLGFNFPTTATLGASTTKYAYKTYCPGTPTATSSYCIAGQFNTRVYGTYGQVTGLGIAQRTLFPNLGYQVVKHIR